MCFVRLLITGDRHLGSVVISASCPSSDARSRLRFYNLMNISAPEQAAVQIIQIYLLFSRSLGGFQYFRIERIISGDLSRKYDKCYCHKMITIQIFQYYLYLFIATAVCHTHTTGGVQRVHVCDGDYSLYHPLVPGHAMTSQSELTSEGLPTCQHRTVLLPRNNYQSILILL